MMPKLDVVTIDHFKGAFLCSFVVGADDVDRFNAVTVTTNKVCLIVSHTGGLRLLLSQPQSLGFTGFFEATHLRTWPHFWHSKARCSGTVGPRQTSDGIIL